MRKKHSDPHVDVLAGWDNVIELNEATGMSRQRNVLYAYSWSLPSSDLTTVQNVMKSIRAFCIELGCEEVSHLSVQPDWVGFTAVVPNSGQHEFRLTFSPEYSSWKASGWLRVSSFKEISRVMFHCATLGVDVLTAFAGVNLCYRRNDLGVIEVELQPAFDPDTF